MNRLFQFVTLVAVFALILPGCALKRGNSRFGKVPKRSGSSGACDCYTCRNSEPGVHTAVRSAIPISSKIYESGVSQGNVSFSDGQGCESCDSSANFISVQPQEVPYYTPATGDPSNSFEPAQSGSGGSVESIAPAPTNFIESNQKIEELPADAPANEEPGGKSTLEKLEDQLDDELGSPSDVIDIGNKDKKKPKDFVATESEDKPVEEPQTVPTVEPVVPPFRRIVIQTEQEKSLEEKVEVEEPVEVPPTVIADNRHVLKARPVKFVRAAAVSTDSNPVRIIPSIPASLKKAIPLNSLRPDLQATETPAPTQPVVQPQQQQSVPISALPPQPHIVETKKPIRLKAVQPGSDANIRARLRFNQPDPNDQYLEIIPSTNAPELIPHEQESPLFDRFTAQAEIEIQPVPPVPVQQVLLTPLQPKQVIETWHERSARIPAGQTGTGELPPWRK